MGYFYSIANQGFKKTEDGQILYYPNGIFSKKGYIVEEPSADKIRKIQKIVFLINFPVLVFACAVINGFLSSNTAALVLMYLALMVVLYTVQYGFYFWKIRPLIIKNQTYSEKLKYSESVRIQAENLGTDTISVLIVLSSIMLLLGIFAAVGTHFRIWADIIIIFFLLALISFVYMLKQPEVKNNQQPDKTQFFNNS